MRCAAPVPDGSSVEVNRQGKATEIWDTQGNHFAFTYDANGNLNTVTNKQGLWTKGEGDTWVKTDDITGKPIMGADNKPVT